MTDTFQPYENVKLQKTIRSKSLVKNEDRKYFGRREGIEEPSRNLRQIVGNQIINSMKKKKQMQSDHIQIASSLSKAMVGKD